MTEDVKVENKETVVETPPQESSVEIKAREMGWRPLEEWDGDPDDWRNAREFVDRKPLYEKIDHLSRSLKDTNRVLKALQEHHSKVKEAEFKRAIEYLKTQKKTALEEGDADKVIAIDDQLVDLKANQQRLVETEQPVQTNEVHPDFAAWVARNQWYANNREMRRVADSVGLDYAADHPDASPSDVTKFVEARIKKMYPEKFENPNRSKASAVDTSSQSAKPGKSSDKFEMTEEEERVMKTFVRSGALSKEEYIEQLKLIKGV